QHAASDSVLLEAHMNGARLLIALGRERELRRLGLALGKNAFAVRIGRPLEGPQQKGKLGPSAQGVTLLFRARLEAEVANVDSVEGDLVLCGDFVGPFFGGGDWPRE